MSPEEGPHPQVAPWLAGGVRRLYSLFMWAAIPWFRRRLRRRARAEPGYGQWVEQRFGHYPGVPPCQGLVWVHAVSLGETRAAGILMNALREQQPGIRFLLTHGTATGRAEGVRYLRSEDVQVWQPWDIPAAVERFLQHFRPTMGVLIETEVWPNMVAACQRHKMPLSLVNARLNERSLRQALRWRWLSEPAYRGLYGVYAQTESDAQRLTRLGAQVRGVLGNLKFDALVDDRQQAQGRAWRSRLGAQRPVWMLASSRDGEERLWADLCPSPVADTTSMVADSRPLWLVVPRHPQRFDAVATHLKERGWRVSRRSEWCGGMPSEDDLLADVWLGDSLGEMQSYYTLADAALLGGSFLPLGGQNLIEAVQCGCPVLMGPHTFNFAQAAEQAVVAGAARRVSTMAEALHWLDRSRGDAKDRELMRTACIRWQEGFGGAAGRYAACVLQTIPAGTVPAV